MFLKAKGRCPFAGECMFGNSMGGTQLPSLLASKGSYSPLPAATGLGLFPTLLLVPSDMYDAHDLAPTCAVPPPWSVMRAFKLAAGRRIMERKGGPGVAED